MNSFHTLKLLSPELNRKLAGATFLGSSTPRRQLWEGVFNKKGTDLFLVCATIPQKTVLFLDDRSIPASGPTVNFFEQLAGVEVEKVEMPFDDRVVDILFLDGRRLRCVLFGPSANIHLLDTNAQISESFRHVEIPGTLKQATGKVGAQKEAQKEAQTATQDARSAQEAPLAADQTFTRATHDKDEPVSGVTDARKIILSRDPRLPRALLEDIIREQGLETSTRSQVISFADRLSRSVTESPRFRLLEDGRFCLFSEEIFPESTATVFDNVNDLIRTCYLKSASLERLTSLKNGLLKRLQRERDSIISSLSQLERKDVALQRAERNERFGHLLLANAHLKPEQGATRVRVSDIYEGGGPVEIPINSGLSMAENAQSYYQKSSSGRQQALRVDTRKTVLNDRLSGINEAIDQITSIKNLREWEKWAKGLGAKWIANASQGGDGEVKPFRILTLNGLDVWIGKHAKGNEALLRLAHKEDIWLHSRHVSGSHVLIRSHSSGKAPSKETIEKAASFAAWHSKARGSGTVPVIWTKRKYVTKPRGAALGQVKVMQENVVDVTPIKPDEEYV